MKKKIKSIAIFLGLLILLNIISLLVKPANAQLGFGGIVWSYQPCNDGVLELIVDIGSGAFGYYFFNPISPPDILPPPPPGFEVLGNAAPVPRTCIYGIVPYGAGLQVEEFSAAPSGLGF